MALLDTSRTAFGSIAAISWISRFFATATNAVVDWNDARITRDALSDLTDRELEDIGLCRGDIDGVARADLFR